MKILHFDFDDLESPIAGGQAVRTYEVNRRLAKMGHEITVVTMDYAGAQNKIKDGVNYRRIGLKKAPWSYVSYFLSIPFQLRKHQFDLVVEDNISPFTFGLSPIYTRKPVISQVQCFFAEESSQKHHLPFWIFQRYGAKAYQNFIVLTQNMAQKIAHLNKNAQVKIIPNGISKTFPVTASPHSNINPADSYFLFLGRITFYHKGLDILLKSMITLQQSAPNLKLIIAGEGEDQDNLLRLIHQYNLKNVIYKGKVHGQAKETLIQNCIALVQPSRFEIFPFTILEAAAHGKPTIAFGIENLKEIVTNIGLLINPFDEFAFAKAMIAIAKDFTTQKALGEKARHWANNHLWDQIVRQQENFYLETLERSKRQKA